MKYYIVQKVGYEYNDEVNYRPECDGGTPEKVFSSALKAEKYADKLNLEELSGCQIRGYGYSDREVVEDGFFDVYNELFNDNLTEIDWDFQLPKLTKDQYNQLKDYIKVKFYEVVECEGE
jgi:hypothetical protein